MPNRIAKRVGSDGFIYFSAYKPGSSDVVYTFKISASNADKLDPVTGLSVSDSVEQYLTFENYMFTSGEEEKKLQSATGRVAVIEQRAKEYRSSSDNNITPSGFQIHPAAQSSDYLNNLYENRVTDTDLLTISGESGNQGQIVDVTKDFFKYGKENTSSNSSGGGQNRITYGQGGNYFETIGGADLSVFYLAEVPLMEDVMDPKLTPDIWRKEVIIAEMDSILSISYSTLRERFPVRRLGESNPIAYTQGPRTIGGHIAFAVFVEDVLTRLRSQVRNSFKKAYDAVSKNTKGIVIDKTADQHIANKVAALEGYYQASLHLDGVQLLDSLPPFHLLVMGVNERGQFSKFIIKGVQIIDENQIQGTVNPHIMNKVTYVAEDIIPMSTFDADPSTITGSLGSLAEKLDSSSYGLLNGLPNFSGSDLLRDTKEDLKKSTL